MDQTIPSNIPNFTSLCRLCLCEDVYMFPIFNETNIYLPQRIAAFLNVEVYKTDNISTLICKQCLSKINDWHEFKKYCNDSQLKLRYWSNLCVSNDPNEYKSNQFSIKEEIVNYDEEEIIIPENVEDIKIELIETSYEDLSNNDEVPNIEENDPVSTTMYFLPDENCEIEPEPETLLVPTHELSPDAHGLNGPLKQPTTTTTDTTNSIVDFKISQVYQVISCRICEINFSSLANRSRHEKIKHMVNFKEIKCFTCNKVWNHEQKLVDHYQVNHQEAKESIFIKPENKIIKNGYTYNTFEKSQEYLKQFAENLISLRNRISSAKKIPLKSFTYYNQCIQKMIDRNSIDSNTSLKNILEHLLSQNLIIRNSCHQCCISFKSVAEFKQHISKRYCKKRVRLVESGQIQPNQHLKCVQCDRIFGCKILLTHHIKSEHCADEVPEKCNTCMKLFHYRYEYSAHIRETCSYQIYCSICDFLFDTTNDFKLHSKLQHEIETNVVSPYPKIFNQKPRKLWPNKCCLCPKVYRYYQDLGKHFKKFHPQFKLKTCEYCGDNFSRDEDIQTHVNNYHFQKSTRTSNARLANGIHNANQIYLCVECNLVFSTIEDLEQHKSIHSSELSDSDDTPARNTLDSPLFTCNICVQTFNFEEELNEHKITNHDDAMQGKRQIKFRCTICRKTFNTNKSLVIHNSRMHSILKSCLKCHKTFKNVKSINIHMKKNHCISTKVKKIEKTTTKLLKIKTEVEDVDEPYTCVVCKKMFTSKKSLICHAKMHYQFNKMQGPYCEVCGKTCETVGDLLDHFKSHPSKSLNNLNNMNSAVKMAQHQQQQQQVVQKQEPKDEEQEQENIEEHKCYSCVKVFSTKFGLNMHHALKHRKSVSKQHSCVICEDSFASINDLVGHVQGHVDNDDKFTCVDCNIPFLSDDYLVHMSKVHNSYTCVFCNKKLTSFSSLMSHKGWHFR